MTVQLHGHDKLDGTQLADLFARDVGVRSPDV
jgi:hypothetical protein